MVPRGTMKWLFKLVWWHWFKDYRIVCIKGWRTALVEGRCGSRMVASPVFSWEKERSYSLKDKFRIW